MNEFWLSHCFWVCLGMLLCCFLPSHRYLILFHKWLPVQACTPVSFESSSFISALHSSFLSGGFVSEELSSYSTDCEPCLWLPSEASCHSDSLHNWLRSTARAPADEAIAYGCCVLHCLVCLGSSVKYLLIWNKTPMFSLQAESCPAKLAVFNSTHFLESDVLFAFPSAVCVF